MRTGIALLVVFALSGCDAWFFRRFDVTPPTTESEMAAVDVVRQFAAGLGVPCPSDSKIPMDCYKQPITLRVARSEGKLIVCYNAMGAPFEESKNEKRISELEQLLKVRFGATAVIATTEQCYRP